ncbi:hypothetical protein Tco_0776396 [Tanacetum coccineum]
MGWFVISDAVVEYVTASWDALWQRHVETVTLSPAAENIILRNVGVELIEESVNGNGMWFVKFWRATNVKRKTKVATYGLGDELGLENSSSKESTQ